MRAFALTAFTFWMIVLLSGCSSPASVSQSEGTGKKVVYAAKQDVVYSALPSILKTVGLDILTNNEPNHTLIAGKGLSVGSAGENVAIFVRPVGEDKSSVEVVSQKVMATQMTARDWSPFIFAELDKQFTRD